MQINPKAKCLLITSLLFLSGCQDTTTDTSNNNLFAFNPQLEPFAANPLDNIQQIALATPEHKNAYKTRLAWKLTKNKQFNLSKKVLVHSTPQSEAESVQKGLILAHNYLIDYKRKQAKSALQTLDNQPLVQMSNNAYYHLLWANYYFQKQQADLSFKHLEQAYQNTTSEKTKIALLKIILHTLQTANTNCHSNIAQQSDAAKAWISLINIIKPEQLASLDNTLAAVNAWQKQHPAHPANHLIQVQKPRSIQNLAVILPMDGNTQTISTAIQDGILATSYLDASNKAHIEFINSSNQDILGVLQQANASTADAIIGPILKEDIEKIAHQKTSKPILLLNSIPNHHQQQHMQNYSIATADEADQLAHSLIEQGHHKALIIYDESSNSDKTQTAFTKSYQSLGGHIQESLKTDGNLNTQIAKIMGISKSNERFQHARTLTHQKLKFLPKRRNDIDSIIVITSNNHARQVIPLLRYYFAGTTPIFSFSNLNTGIVDPFKDKDLDHVVFLDSPSMASQKDNNPHIYQILHELYQQQPKTFQKNTRFFALGIDAYIITRHGYLWDIIPDAIIPGANGDLTRDAQGNIHRNLRQLVFKKGLAKQQQSYHWQDINWAKVLNQAL